MFKWNAWSIFAGFIYCPSVTLQQTRFCFTLYRMWLNFQVCNTFHICCNVFFITYQPAKFEFFVNHCIVSERLQTRRVCISIDDFSSNYFYIISDEISKIRSNWLSKDWLLSNNWVTIWNKYGQKSAHNAKPSKSLLISDFFLDN